MRILVTGSDGQVGKALTQLVHDIRDQQTWGWTNRGSLDITDSKDIADQIKRFKPDVMVNLAAYTDVQGAESDFQFVHKVNGAGPGFLARACSVMHVRLIHISTDYVFSGKDQTYPWEALSQRLPVNEYGKSKKIGEDKVMLNYDAGGEYVILRTSWIHSEFGMNFVKKIVARLKDNESREPIRVVSDQIGTPTHAYSVAEAIYSIIAKPDLRGIYHWTDAGVASWYDVACYIRDKVGSSKEIHPIMSHELPSGTVQRPKYSVLRRHADDLGMIDSYHWMEGIDATLKAI